MAVDQKLWEIVVGQFPMGTRSHHGPGHWKRVLKFGQRLGVTTGADSEIVELFALFHDSRRMNDQWDPGHGKRGAELALRYHGTHFSVSRERLDLLVIACRDHTEGGLTEDPTIGTCWDADRLDLWRVGIYPNPRYFCTEEARKPEVIEWAVKHVALI